MTLPKISELDAAIIKVLGLELVTQLKSTHFRFNRVRLHQHACLLAFEKAKIGPEIDVLRTLLAYLNEHSKYPPDSWDVD